jgi:BCD family chlorophyll transporter-like MFS transporter
MKRINLKFVKAWADLGPRFLPFADAASPDLPLSRLLRLSLFQVSVGMALVLLIGTLNRVMIVELGVSASLVAVMVSLPLVFAPFRALIGFKSDTHRSELGWRRVPYIWMGTLVQFGGLAIMPFALLVLSGAGNAAEAPAWVGQVAAAFAFLLVGAGIHITQTVGLALATDLSDPESQPKVVGLMYVMLLVGMILSAILFGVVLRDFSPGRLIQVIQCSAVITLILNSTALWKQEARDRSRRLIINQPSFKESWNTFCQGDHSIRRLLAIGLGTMAFAMEDVLLEPYGGEILQLSVSATTVLTATLALGGLFGFSLASNVLSRGFNPFLMAKRGALVGIPAFIAVIAAAPIQSPLLFSAGVFLIGFGGGLFSHGTLTATMNLAPPNQRGLALGAWGAVQATGAGLAVALGGIIRDLINALAVRRMLGESLAGPATGYISVYLIEIILLVVTVLAMLPLIKTPTTNLSVSGSV